MTGVILDRCPSAGIVDICHLISARNIAQAARMLEVSYPYFPRRTIHLIVVDPGVGTDRQILVVEAAEHIFIAPDNGILTPLLHSKKLQSCSRLNIGEEQAVSSTFHGRDIMAPAAAKLAAGTAVAELARLIDPEKCVTISFPSPQIEKNRITGEVTAIDHFGNILTSIRADHISAMNTALEVCIGKTTIRDIRTAYAEVAPQSPVALINSRGDLEIAVNAGNAAEKLHCKVGDIVVVRSCQYR
jgi:hypothetical protein